MNVRMFCAHSLGLAVFLFLFSFSLKAQEAKLFNGFDGGMMLHTGYLYGNFPQLGYPVSGAPFGIGGVIRIHLGNHWRVGGEGYVSTLNQRGNGSYVKYGWGGLLGDFYWTFGRFMPYAGLTLGGGANTNLLIMSKKTDDWKPLENSYYNRQGFFALDPYIGCDYIVSEKFHLTLKADWLNCFSRSGKIPSGPRLYIGFIFYH